MKKIVVRKIIQIVSVMVLLCFVQQSGVFATEMQLELKAPKNVRIYRPTNTSLKLKWSAVQDADGYMIYKYNKTKNKYQLLKVIKDSGQTEWSDKGLLVNKIYKYRVCTYKEVNHVKYYSKLSRYAKAKTYKRDGKKINAGKPKVSNKKIYLGLCSRKKIKVNVFASKYGTNKNKRAFDTKVRWYSNNPSIARVNQSGVITAGAKEGKCYVYVMAHNGKKTRITVVVKNYARAKSYYNNWVEDDLYTLTDEYKDYIQNIAEYFSINRIKSSETLEFNLNDDAEVVTTPNVTIDEKIREDIEYLLVNFPYEIRIKVYGDSVEFISEKDFEINILRGYVVFWFDNDCSEWSTQIASHWESVRFYPD